MKFVERHSYVDPEAAARKLVEIASTIEPTQDGDLVLARSAICRARPFSSEKSGRSSYHARVIGPWRRSRGLLPCRYDGRS